MDPDQFAQFHHLLYPLPLAFILIILRFLTTKHIFKPLAIKIGLKSRNKPCHAENFQLESVFNSSKGQSPARQDLARLSEQTGLSVIQVRIILFFTNLNYFLIDVRLRDGSDREDSLTLLIQQQSFVRQDGGRVLFIN